MADIEIHSEEDFEADEEGDSKYCIFYEFNCCNFSRVYTRNVESLL